MSSVFGPKQKPSTMMNSSLTFSQVDLRTDENARYVFGDTVPSKACMKASRDLRHLDWTSFDAFIEKASPMLAALYLAGALGFTAVLVYNALVY
jgi:hypothetical protein